jgi:hypothetical protein
MHKNVTQPNGSTLVHIGSCLNSWPGTGLGVDHAAWNSADPGRLLQSACVAGGRVGSSCATSAAWRLGAPACGVLWVRRKDLYETLQVPRGANDAQMKRSYRKLALQYHPVRGAGTDGP